MNKKLFKYTLQVEDVPYNEDTVKYLFGEDAEYNPDYPEDIMAKNLIHEIFQDAIGYCLQTKIELLEKTKQSPKDMNKTDKEFWDYLEYKQKKYRQIQKTISLIGVNND